MNTVGIDSFFDELEKIGASALRRRVALIETAKNWYTLFLNGKAIGKAQMSAPGRILKTEIRPQYQGLGLGKKMYGELMRRAPGQHLKSDRSVSEEAARVWKGMKKRKGYKVWENPGAVEKQWPYRRYETGVRKGGILNPDAGFTRSGPAFTGKLPPKSAIKE